MSAPIDAIHVRVERWWGGSGGDFKLIYRGETL